MSANTRISADTRNGNGNFKVVHLGKDQRPISVMKLATMEDPSWKRGATFNHLEKAMRGQLANYTMADLLTVVANELPISTESAMEEAQATGEKLKRELFMVENLEGQHFMDSKGKIKPVSSDKLDERPEDLTYFAFMCTVEPQDVDERILQERLAVNFSLKLPLSIYDTDEDKIIETLGKRSSHKKSRNGAKGLDKLVGMRDEGNLGSVKKSLFRQEEDEGGEEEDWRGPKSPAKDGTTLGQQNTSDTGLSTLSPKMSRLLGKKASQKVITGYFGPFTFLDNQVAFDDVFGAAPTILGPLPLKDASVLKEDIDDFVDHCKFDIFMASCRSYYVGVENSESDIQATHAACKSICELRMEEKVNGRIIVLNPDVLFSKFMEITPLLPDNASKWSTQLCSAYFNALTPELRARMENDSFIMPALNQLNTKKDQIDALQIVRDKTSTAFKNLKDQTDLITSIIARSSNGQARRTGNQFVTEDATQAATPTVVSNDANASRILAYGQKSPAEETMQKYSSRTPNPANLPVKDIGGVLYPYRLDDPSFISKYPLGFRGCFKCGVEIPHVDGFNACPKARGDHAAKMAFFRELWIHKPSTKDNATRNFGTAGQDRNGRRDHHRDNHNVSYSSAYDNF